MDPGGKRRSFGRQLNDSSLAILRRKGTFSVMCAGFESWAKRTAVDQGSRRLVESNFERYALPRLGTLPAARVPPINRQSRRCSPGDASRRQRVGVSPVACLKRLVKWL